MLKVCPHYHELEPILGDRNADVANTGNSCGDAMPLATYKSPFASSSVGFIFSAAEVVLLLFLKNILVRLLIPRLLLQPHILVKKYYK